MVVESRLEPQIFRVLLLRRLWCPLPLSAHFCRCGRPLVTFVATTGQLVGRAGVLGRRGFPLEIAATRVCREAGGRVSVNVRVADLDLLPPAEDRRQEERGGGRRTSCSTARNLRSGRNPGASCQTSPVS